MKDIKKHPMLLTKAAKLLAEEHPEFAFTAAQLQGMCKRRLIPCLCLPTCGMERKYRHMVIYPEIVRHFKSCQRSAIS
jgi:hypothetical protein